MNDIMQQAISTRTAQHQIHPLLLGRWSPRAMSGETISQEEFSTLLEAARWAPSSYNRQPWRFLYASRDSEYWNDFFELLVEFNQSWAKNASHLVLILSAKNFEHNGKPNAHHAFDAGAAWQNLALQGAEQGLVIHGIGGFDAAKARTELKVPDNHEVLVMVAIGKAADASVLPETMQDGETPSSRKELSEISWEGPFR